MEQLKTKVINGKRHYLVPSGNYYPSVTTVLSILPKPKLEEWKARVGEQVAEYVKVGSGIRGNQTHKLIEEFLRERQIDGNEIQILGRLRKDHPSLLPWALFENLVPLLREINTVTAQEATLYSDDLKIAGRLDCVGEFNKMPAIIDFKTATKMKSEDDIQDYFQQATAYSLMWEERTGEKIENIVIMITCESGDRQVFIKNREDYISALRKTIEQFYATPQG